jgi:hypothetical protein
LEDREEGSRRGVEDGDNMSTAEVGEKEATKAAAQEAVEWEHQWAQDFPEGGPSGLLRLKGDVPGRRVDEQCVCLLF